MTIYYAVRIGRCPGIYTDATDAEAQVLEFPNSDFKPFDNLIDAQQYISSILTVTPAVLQSVIQSATLPSNVLQDHSTIPEPRILSIQSSVVYGYVGNKASNYPIQLHGYDVDSIHTCQLSNHTGYKSFKGRKSECTELQQLVCGLRDNNLLHTYTHILTGYLGTCEFASEVMSVLQSMRQQNPNTFILIDPVLGDRGKLYMPAEMVDIYKSALLTCQPAVITPNQTEAELLTDCSINSLQSAFDVCCVLHRDKHIPTVVITSIDNVDNNNDYIHIIATTISTTPGIVSINIDYTVPPTQYLHIKVHRTGGYYSGTGDLMSALLLVWLCKSNNLQTALEYTVNTLQAVIQRTHAAGSNELKLVQSKSDLEQPQITYKAMLVNTVK